MSIVDISILDYVIVGRLFRYFPKGDLHPISLTLRVSSWIDCTPTSSSCGRSCR